MSTSIEDLESQLKSMAEAQIKETDWLSSAIKDLYLHLDALTTQIRTCDVNVAALRQLLVLGAVLKDADIERKREELIKLINDKLSSVEKQAKKEQKPLTIEDEVQAIHTAAKEAAGKHPDKAFFFGG